MSRALPRFLETELTRRDHAQKLERIAREAAGDVSTQKRSSSTPGDTRTLRGIPAIGRGVAGVIPGSKPGG